VTPVLEHTQGLTHTYRPQGGCRDLWESRADEVLISGPGGTGKTRSALEKLHALMLANPGAAGLITRKWAVKLRDSAIPTFERFVIPEALTTGLVTYFGGSNREPPGWRYRNRSRLSIAGMDNPSKVMSTEYDAIYVNEAIELEEEDWEALTMRLRNGVISFQQLLADTNPGQPTHWLKQRVDRGSTQLIESRHEDNPVLCHPDGSYTERGAAYIARLDSLTGVRHSRYRLGLWVAAEGVIWDGYDPAVHVIPAFEIPADWPRFLSIDWGFTHPLVVQWWAEDPDGRLFRYRELYRTGLLASEAGEIVKRINTETGERITRAVSDHASGDRAAFTKASGIRTHPADKAVDVGLQTVAARWKPAADGRPRMYLLKGALIERDPAQVEARLPTCTEEEIPGYVWDRSTAARREKEQPVKANDDGCDATRYMAMERRRRTRINLGAA
jgi:PBSX family phage terminase large subunit